MVFFDSFWFTGLLKQIDAGGNAFIVGVNKQENIFCLQSGYTMNFKGVGGVSWTGFPGSLKYFSCGPNGCWGANMNDDVFFMKVIYGIQFLRMPHCCT